MVRRLSDPEMDPLNIIEWIRVYTWSIQALEQICRDHETLINKFKGSPANAKYVPDLERELRIAKSRLEDYESQLREYKEAYKEYASEK